MAFTHELVAECLQNEQAFCTIACPFNLDIRDFIGMVQQGRFNIAYRTFQNVVGFPGIVTALCPEPCKLVCPLKDAGGSISLKELEKSSIGYARSTEPSQYNVPLKDKRIAIIGAGISGLACALRLTSRKYQVTVFEKSDRIGGHLNTLLSPDIFLADIGLQFKHEQYLLNLNKEVSGLDDLEYDAVYVATGKDGNQFGLSHMPDGTFSTSRPGVFMGGSVVGTDTMTAIVHGLNASNAIETWLKIGSMNHVYSPLETKLLYESIRVKPADAIMPSNGESYSKEEAIAESNRCLKCCCDACNFYSPLMSYFRKFPRRITEEVQVSLTPSSLDGNAKLATRLISTCTHCGLCKEVCPKDIDTGEFLLTSHKTMRNQGTMPWAFHEFYLRDMEFSISDAGLTKLPKGFDRSTYLFFPGCQLGASDPEYVIRSYRFLLEHFPDTALSLGCCGVPAEWAGVENFHAGVINRIREDWKKLGKPVTVLACPTCMQMFRKHLPEINTEFLYPMLEKSNLALAIQESGTVASVYDPCASREEPALQETIRQLSRKAGFQLEPLPMEGRMAECCSYGGHVSIAHPPYANHMIQKRVSQKSTPYITYCSNCRDIFAYAGKKSWHILDILFGIEKDNPERRTVSGRQRNRLNLKRQVLEEFWNEKLEMDESMKMLEISDGLKEKLHKNYILEMDLLAVIESAEETGKKLYDPEKKSYTSHKQIGNMTYWVEYLVIGSEGYELLNGYCHRMKIEE